MMDFWFIDPSTKRVQSEFEISHSPSVEVVYIHRLNPTVLLCFFFQSEAPYFWHPLAMQHPSPPSVDGRNPAPVELLDTTVNYETQ